MLRFIAMLLAALQFGMLYDSPAERAVFGMKTGVTLRMHVVAHDDSPEMQAIKLQVRDGVRTAYAASTPPDSLPMLLHAARLLPELTTAAEQSAQKAGFSGEVSVTLGLTAFDERTLDGLTFPAGAYPALMIRLGDAQGQNWWGLIDQRLALCCAAVDSPLADDCLAEPPAITWDWSLDALAAAWRIMLSRLGL